MRPSCNGLALCSLYWLVLLMAVALTLSAMLILWSTLPVQAQSESTDKDTSEGQPTGKHLIAFSGDTLPQDYAERIAEVGGSVETDFPEIGVVIANGLTEEAAQSLGSSEGVEVVEQDVERQWLDPVENAPAEVMASEEMMAEIAPASPGNPATALAYPRQKWSLEAIKADKAWQQNRLGSPNVTVAILDTGIDATEAHVDVRGRVDRTRSKSFVSSDDQYLELFSPRQEPWTDFHNHGTHVASTASSNANLGAGVTSKVQLMAVKVLDRNGVGSTSDVLEGLMYAADNEADVINMSLEGFLDKKRSPGDFMKVIKRAFTHAEKKGSAIVVAAGNDNLDLRADRHRYQLYCQSPNVVCVAATGPKSQASVNGPWTDIDAKASYSNFGKPVTVAAPGGNGDSRVWAACPRTSLRTAACRTGSTLIGLNGTSMAAPHVSGLAALLVEDIGKGKPSKVSTQIRKSADDLGDRGEDVVYGHGRINVAKALRLEEGRAIDSRQVSTYRSQPDLTRPTAKVP
jgi:subtilisin family serine protease